MTLLDYEQRAVLLNEAESALTEAKRWNALCGPQASFVNHGGSTANAEVRIQAAVTRARNLLSRIETGKP